MRCGLSPAESRGKDGRVSRRRARDRRRRSRPGRPPGDAAGCAASRRSVRLGGGRAAVAGVGRQRREVGMALQEGARLRLALLRLQRADAVDQPAARLHAGRGGVQQARLDLGQLGDVARARASRARRDCGGRCRWRCRARRAARRRTARASSQVSASAATLSAVEPGAGQAVGEAAAGAAPSGRAR